MITSSKFYSFLAVCVLINIVVNGWAIYRGLLFIADHKLPGLQLTQGALAFTQRLVGKIQGSHGLDVVFPRLNQTFIFTYSFFPIPNENTMHYPATSVTRYVDVAKYTERCLQIESNTPPGSYLLYGNTVMFPNGTGLKGRLCQEKFHDSAAYARMDSLCTGLACFRADLLLGCLDNHELHVYAEHDCGRINQLTPGLHWSGTSTLTLDPDSSMVLASWMQLNLGENQVTFYADGALFTFFCVANTAFVSTVYTFIPTVSGTYKFSFCGENTDTIMQIDNSCSDNFCNDQSELTVVMNAGQVYNVIVSDSWEYSVDTIATLTITKLLITPTQGPGLGDFGGLIPLQTYSTAIPAETAGTALP